MNLSNIFITRLKKYYAFFIIPIIGLYIFMNIFDGNNGLLAHKYLNNEINSLQNQIAKTKSENTLLNIKIDSLKSSSKNNDLIDEQVRSVLGYGKNGEFTVFFDKQ